MRRVLVLAAMTAVVMAAGCANGSNDAGAVTPTSNTSAAAGNRGADTTEVIPIVEARANALRGSR